MRKWSAMILLVPVLLLFVEWLKAPSVCASGCGQVVVKQACHHACGGACKKTQKRKEKKSGDCATTCLDCPICALVTFNPFIRFEVSRPESFMDYAVMPDNNLTDYFQRHWKPPDRFPHT